VGEQVEPIAATAAEEIERRVARVASKKDDWVKTPIAHRLALLRACIDGVLSVAPRWVEGGCRMKGILPDHALAGEEWLVGPWDTIRNLRLLVAALEQKGAPRPPRMRTREDGQRIAQVFPATVTDRILFTGFRAEVWIEPGKPATQGAIYRAPQVESGAASGKVCLVLGAGNVSSIPPMDVLYKLFVENEVAILKINPVNDFIGPLLEEAFKPLVDEGFLAIVHGGADVGALLSSHPRIDTLHVTGSDRTYDAIVWGPPAEQAERKAKGDRKNERPFSAELGCVTPILVVPGPWSAADLRFQAQQVAGSVVQNASFNCNAGKVLTLAAGWLQKDAFVREVRAALAKTPARKAYYPGAEARWRGFVERYPQAEMLSPAAPGTLPWTYIPHVPPRTGEHALTTEAFCGVLAEVSLDADDPAAFLDQAVRFANESCWGTLSVTLLVHPSTMRDHRVALARAIADLRYGGIGVNCWSAVAYALVSPSWGAFPGHTPEDIRSGTGVVHNAWLFDHPQKSVVYAPFRIRPTPVWFPERKNLARLARAMTEHEAHPSVLRLLKVLGAAL
jgi:acyl-CoA reductase-like NAD-dependent aldehyde dehydrogenase